MHNKPIRIMTLTWGQDDSFFATYTNIHPLMGILLFLSQMKNTLVVKELDLPLDPLYVYKKYGVKESDPEAWSYVAQEVRKIMQFMTGFQTCEEGFKDITKFENEQCHKNNIFQVKLFSRECKKCADEIGVKNGIPMSYNKSKAVSQAKKIGLVKNKIL